MTCDSFFIINTCEGTPIRYFILYNCVYSNNSSKCKRVEYCEKCSRHLTFLLKENEKLESGFYYREITKEQYSLYKILE